MAGKKKATRSKKKSDQADGQFLIVTDTTRGVIFVGAAIPEIHDKELWDYLEDLGDKHGVRMGVRGLIIEDVAALVKTLGGNLHPSPKGVTAAKKGKKKKNP